MEFEKLLTQDIILENLVLTGLRGVGKTVLLETFKPVAIASGWRWVGADMSESSTVSEESLSVRLLADLAVVTSNFVIGTEVVKSMGLNPEQRTIQYTLDFSALKQIWESTPGLASDKLRKVLEVVWETVKDTERAKIIFAYDEAQNLTDHAQREQYPLSLLLDVFQSIQRKNIPFMLALTGLPTLFPKLVEARTFSERMFHQVFLDRLSHQESRDAIVTPTNHPDCTIKFTDATVDLFFEATRGYPYFIQYMCREVFDAWTQQLEDGREMESIPVTEIVRKLDTDFFAGRWSRATDRQRDLLGIIAELENCASEFTVQEIVQQSKAKDKPFSASHVSQMLVSLATAGLVYKNRWGKYSFAVPLLGQFIQRQNAA